MSRLASFVAPLVAVGLLALLAPGTARAYRTSQDSDWNRMNGITGRIAFSPLPVPFSLYRGTSDVPLADLRTATRAAFDTWTAPSCTALVVRDDGDTTTAAIYGDDRNVLEWVEDGTWSARGFGRFTIGVTTNQFLTVGSLWTIDESDMELNADNYNWVIEGGEPDADPVDVQGLVVHEAGHFLGLLHPCEQTAMDGAPACPATSEPETMFPQYTGENQRTLEADDVAGICFLYPAPDCSTTGCPTGLRCVSGACVGDDAGALLDAGVPPSDAGARDAASTGPDAGTDPGAGGCGCRASAADDGGPWALWALLGLALLRRRG